MERVLELDRSLEGEHPDLTVHFELDWSAMRSARSGREIFVWAVDNRESRGHYLTEIFYNDKGALCGCCTCLANSFAAQCKHLNHCLIEFKHFEKKEETNAAGATTAD